MTPAIHHHHIHKSTPHQMREIVILRLIAKSIIVFEVFVSRYRIDRADISSVLVILSIGAAVIGSWHCTFGKKREVVWY